MNHIKLIELTVSGPNVVTSNIKFAKKLTIISGPSNVGKSCIYKCLDYALGAKNNNNELPLDPNDGYDTIKLKLENDHGAATLTRKLGTNEIHVDSNITGLESTNYVFNESKKNPHGFNELFLTLLGAPTNIKLPRNDKGDEAGFTWRTLLQGFFIEEEETDTKKPILLPSQFGQPLYLASMIYMITEDELDIYKKNEKSISIKKARKNALLEYIGNQREKYKTKLSELTEQLSAFGADFDFKRKINELNEKLRNVNQEIDSYTINNKILVSEMMNVQDRLAKNNASMINYSSLQKSYSSEIERLTFIVDNAALLKNKQTKSRCPFCDNEVTPRDHSSYIKASQAELIKVVNYSNALEDTRSELKDQIDDDKALLQDYKERIDDNKNTINTMLIPQREELTSLIKQYESYFQIKSLYDSMETIDNGFGNDILELENEKIEEFKKFKGKDILYPLIQTKMETYSKSILESIGYAPINNIEFTKDRFDLVINNKAKVYNGKGYKALTNSVVLLAWRQLMEDSAKINPHFYFFDSPLKGLFLPEGIEVTRNIRKGFFQYLADLDTTDQIIIVENTNNGELPIIESGEDTMIYNFTKSNTGNYGFLVSVRNEEDKSND